MAPGVVTAMLLTQSQRLPPSPPGRALCLAEVDPAFLPCEGAGFQIERMGGIGLVVVFSSRHCLHYN